MLSEHSSGSGCQAADLFMLLNSVQTNCEGTQLNGSSPNRRPGQGKEKCKNIILHFLSTPPMVFRLGYLSEVSRPSEDISLSDTGDMFNERIQYNLKITYLI